MDQLLLVTELGHLPELSRPMDETRKGQARDGLSERVTLAQAKVLMIRDGLSRLHVVAPEGVVIGVISSIKHPHLDSPEVLFSPSPRCRPRSSSGDQGLLRLALLAVLRLAVRAISTRRRT